MRDAEERVYKLENKMKFILQENSKLRKSLAEIRGEIRDAKKYT